MACHGFVLGCNRLSAAAETALVMPSSISNIHIIQHQG